MVEIRFIGRGGQGVVSAAQLLAEAAVLEDKYVQAFPEFGAERSGAPISAYARLSKAPIEIHSLIRNPDVIVVVDRSLSTVKSSTSGLNPHGIFLANYEGSIGELRARLGLQEGIRVFSVHAREIALGAIGKDFPNTPILGALVKVSQFVRLDSVQTVLAERFKGKLKEANENALKLGYEGVVGLN